MADGNNINTQSHYRGKRTIYDVAEEFGLNSYEFDILKRVMRCRHKGSFTSDLQKSKDVIDIYIKEQGEKNK
jgi:hypothetical protein